jgi:hypothetical protein
MTRILLIGVALATFACGGSDRSVKAGAGSGGAAQSSAATPATGSAANANASTAPNSGAPQGVDKVTLVGCLQGPSTPGATGTSGTAAARGAEGPGAVTAGAGTSSEPFMLVDATAESAASAGVGANGAGGSGGPLVSGRSSFVLDAVTADARINVNKQVRVTGRIDARPYATGTPAGAAAAGTTSASGAGSAGAPTGSAAGSAPATNGTATGAAAVPPVRHLAVESVEVVADSCTKK